MIIILLYLLIPAKLLSFGTSTIASLSSFSSPYIETQPPKGTIPNEKVVSPVFLFSFKIFGPKPIEKSEQYTLKLLAAIKCPSSCIETKTPNAIKNNKIDNIVFKFRKILICGYKLMTEYIIKRLTPDLMEDYFDFFDNGAFSDGSPFYPC